MEALHTAGIHFAEVLQSGPPWMENFWITITSVADPKCIFTVCFPLAYFLDRKVGVAVLWVGLVAEWLNVVFKWFLFGERPFWWIHESGFASRQPLTLRQFPVSCETGPGSPSGHCMITGAALWPLVTALTALASRHSKRSIRLATAWCKDPSWLRLDTRPFASICRVAGSSLGLGLAAGDPQRWDKPLPPRQRAACAVLALAAVRGLQHIPQPQQVTLWYASSFLKYTAGPGMVAVLLPRIARTVTRPQSPPHAE